MDKQRMRPSGHVKQQRNNLKNPGHAAYDELQEGHNRQTGRTDKNLQP